MKVLDLKPGLGARSIAFIKSGFQIACAVEDDDENAYIYNELVKPKDFIFSKIQDVDPQILPDVDVVLGRLLRGVYAGINRKDSALVDDTNNAIQNIIACKRPKFFVLETPVGFLTRNYRQITEYILNKFVELGYQISYNIFDESRYSGYPVSGKELFFVGIRKDLYQREYYFSEPILSNYKREFQTENEGAVDAWYRQVQPFEGLEYIKGKLYLREGSRTKETKLIQSGYFRAMYMVDAIGLRRFTHNELAWLKGIENYNFDKCSSKSRMYSKIANSSSVYVVEAIARSINDYTGNKKENQPTSAAVISKKKEPEQKSIIFPRQRITNIHINKLKGLENLDIPIDRSLTAIMGVNGSGKSTILHALACAHLPYEKGDNYKFSFFFTPNPDSDWKNSSLELTYYDENEQREITRTYKKDSNRWSPRYDKRPIRDAYFIGIETCIPEIEKEKQTSFINYSTDSLDDKSALKIKQKAAYILNKDYQGLTMHRTKKKELLGVHTDKNLTYSSLSMGAGEQRVLKILRLLYSANHYSLILIDEIDLLLHITALTRLIKEIYNIAEKRRLQIVFTTHSLEVAKLSQYVDIRYLSRLNQKTMVYHSVNVDMIYEMSDVTDQPIEVYVEDLLAEAIINRIAEDLNILRFVKVVKYGAASNAFVLAASYLLREADYSNVLIILDGDVYRESDEKVEGIKKVLSGTEREHEEKVNNAVSIIKQLILPAGISPERHIYEMLIEMDPQNEIVRHAKSMNAVADNHQWLNDLTVRMGQKEELTLYRIMDIVSQNHRWGNYIKDVRDWLIEKREQLNLEIIATSN